MTKFSSLGSTGKPHLHVWTDKIFFLKKMDFFLLEWKRFCLTFLRISNFSSYSTVYFISEMWPKHISKLILLNNTAFSRWWINEIILSYITCRMSSWILSIGLKVQAKEYHIIMFMSVMLKTWKVLFGSFTDQVSHTRHTGIGRRKKGVTKITPLICHLAMKLRLSKVTAVHSTKVNCSARDTSVGHCYESDERRILKNKIVVDFRSREMPHVRADVSMFNP